MIELSLVSDPVSRAVINSAGAGVTVASHCNWQVNDVVVKCDIAKLDAGMENVDAKQTPEDGTL
eukprot:1841568-Prorocentrum_lima.AAC.1